MPELWIYHQDQLSIYILENSQYILSKTSPNFPHIAITEIIETAVKRSWEVGSFQALEEVEAVIYQ